MVCMWYSSHVPAEMVVGMVVDIVERGIEMLVITPGCSTPPTPSLAVVAMFAWSVVRKSEVRRQRLEGRG